MTITTITTLSADVMVMNDHVDSGDDNGYGRRMVVVVTMMVMDVILIMTVMLMMMRRITVVVVVVVVVVVRNLIPCENERTGSDRNIAKPNDQLFLIFIFNMLHFLHWTLFSH